MTRLCVPIFVTDLEAARRDIALAAEAGADVVELRIDRLPWLTSSEDQVTQWLRDVSQLIRQAGIPCILTLRTATEGGFSEIPDEARNALVVRIADAGDAAYVDFELAAQKRLGERFRHPRASLILSSHDFDSRPPRLTAIVQTLFDGPADVAKVVWTARSIRDNVEAFEILGHRAKPTIALCMGEHGIVSRILAKKFGAFLTFAALTKDSGTAPGQVSIGDMKGLYRWDAIGAGTKVYGVVASPVMHSMSPAIHNTAFEAVGHDGVYLPLLVNEGYESFKAFMETFLRFEPLHLSGLSVTLPHKENALRYLTEVGGEVEELAARIGAVNTVVVERVQGSGFRVQEGGARDAERAMPEAPFRLRGLNTDYAAILDSITDKLGITREQLEDYRVAVIGAGGTGRTAVAALAHYGATIVVYNRTMDRAEALAAEFNGKRGKVVAARMEKLCDSCCQIYLNCTSVGMYPNVDASPLGDAAPAFTADTVVFDTIYNPMKTKLLATAEAAGAKTIGGIEMFVRQAVRQFESWTGKAAPVDVMRGVVERRLAGPK